jgi:hypothetical protein
VLGLAHSYLGTFSSLKCILEASASQSGLDLLIFQSGAGLIFSIILMKFDAAALHGCLARTFGRSNRLHMSPHIMICCTGASPYPPYMVYHLKPVSERYWRIGGCKPYKTEAAQRSEGNDSLRELFRTIASASCGSPSVFRYSYRRSLLHRLNTKSLDVHLVQSNQMGTSLS